MIGPETQSALISLAGVVFSLAGAVYVAGRRDGRRDTRIDFLEEQFRSMANSMATKEQLAGVKEDVAEIKGMFRMTLRDSA